MRKAQGLDPEEAASEQRYLEVFGQEAIDQARAAFRERVSAPWNFDFIGKDPTAEEPVDPQTP